MKLIHLYFAVFLFLLRFRANGYLEVMINESSPECCCQEECRHVLLKVLGDILKMRHLQTNKEMSRDEVCR